MAFRGGTPMCGRWGCVPADRRAVVSRGQAVICGVCSLLCTPGVAAGGVAQLAVGKEGGLAGEKVGRVKCDSVGMYEGGG